VKEAVSVLEKRLGPNAKVLSVRKQQQPLWKRALEGERLEIVAELPREPVGFSDGSYSGASVKALVTPVPSEGSVVLDLRSALGKAGFSERLLPFAQARYAGAVTTGQGLAADVEAFVAELCRHVNVTPLPSAGAPIAFLSDCHSDKNLALSQWLAWEVFAREACCRVCHVDSARPNPYLELEVFCQAIGVELTHYVSGKQVFTDPKGLCWDLPWTIGDSEAIAIIEALDKNAVKTRAIVQNASYEADCLRENVKRAKRIGATHLVLTRFDQVRNVAKIWDLLIEFELAPLFFSADDSLLSTMRVDPLKQLAGRTLGVT